jgi:hypothetical protein
MAIERHYLHTEHKLCLYLAFFMNLDPRDTIRKQQRDRELGRSPHPLGQKETYVWCLRFE